MLPFPSCFAGYLSVLAVVLKTNNASPWTNEFDSKSSRLTTLKKIQTSHRSWINVLVSLPVSLLTEVELSCVIESISTINPRIEWKKITSGGPSYVYFDKKIYGNTWSSLYIVSICYIFSNIHLCCAFILAGDLENRAVIREPATLLITNATRSDTAKYRCEVTAADDQKAFDEILLDLVVRGTLTCLTDNWQKMLLNTESRSLLRPQRTDLAQRFRRRSTSDAVRWNRVVGCANPLAYMWGCVVTRPAQLQRRVLGYKRKPLKLHLLGIAVLKKASVFWHGAKITFPSTPCQSWQSSQTSGSGWH